LRNSRAIVVQSCGRRVNLVQAQNRAGASDGGERATTMTIWLYDIAILYAIFHTPGVNPGSRAPVAVARQPTKHRSTPAPPMTADVRRQ